MSDGAYICIGKGNPEWNCSAPHGAGRLMSRNAARRNCSMEEFTRRMSGIYTTCVSESTIDESPMAYKNPVDILSQINDTAEVIEKLTPVFSFKSPS
jgi:RNA-splicing ligase RtcB